MQDRRRLLCIEVVLLAAVVACTGSEGERSSNRRGTSVVVVVECLVQEMTRSSAGPSVEELSITQLVELAETGPKKGALGWVCSLRIRVVPTTLDQMN